MTPIRHIKLNGGPRDGETRTLKINMSIDDTLKTVAFDGHYYNVRGIDGSPVEGNSLVLDYVSPHFPELPLG